MATAEVAMGALDTGELGPTYMHEDGLVVDSDVQQNYPAHSGRERDPVADVAEPLKPPNSPTTSNSRQDFGTVQPVGPA
jgi:phosphotriesterase-related protein